MPCDTHTSLTKLPSPAPALPWFAGGLAVAASGWQSWARRHVLCSLSKVICPALPETFCATLLGLLWAWGSSSRQWELCCPRSLSVLMFFRLSWPCHLVVFPGGGAALLAQIFLDVRFLAAWITLSTEMSVNWRLFLRISIEWFLKAVVRDQGLTGNRIRAFMAGKSSFHVIASVQ